MKQPVSEVREDKLGAVPDLRWTKCSVASWGKTLLLVKQPISLAQTMEKEAFRRAGASPALLTPPTKLAGGWPSLNSM